MKRLVFLCLALLCSDVFAEDVSFGKHRLTRLTAQILVRCESVVTEVEGGQRVQYRPLRTLKGSLPDELTGAEGLLLWETRFPKDVQIPPYYDVYLKKRRDLQDFPGKLPAHETYQKTLLARQKP